MSSSLQTVLALAVVAAAVIGLAYSFFGKRHSSGCGGGGCGAVSPEVKKLQARLRRQ